MALRTTLGTYHRPTFEARAEYVAVREMKWGRNDIGYVKVPSNLDEPLDLEALDPPCDAVLAAKLYRTGFIAMVLTEDGKPKLRGETATPQPVRPPPPPPPPPPDTPRQLRIKSHGFARYTVIDQDGNRASPEGKWLSKTEAEAFISA